MRSRTAVTSAIVLLSAACAQAPTIQPEALTAAEAPAAVVVAEPAQAPAAPVSQRPEPPKIAAPPPPAHLWERVRAGFRLPNLNGPLVREWEQWYATRPDYVARMVERSSRFLYHVVVEVERRGMPSEIALLPMIESAYNPQAYSRSHASGMWQFIPSTGKLYGLRQNFWYDGRRDPIAATNAALDYLEKLYGMFGNWELALAAYNWGEGAVARAIARNQAKGLATDYESLTMPNETRNYVPKLQAVKNIVTDPAQYGLRLAEVPNEPYIATVTTGRHIDVALAARLAEIPLEEFKFLNPGNNKPVIKADGSETIVLPRDKVEAFQRNLEAHDKPLVSWQAYTVKRSDQPAKLAAKHGITLARLKEVNGINGRRNIVAGQTILVPFSGNVEPHLPDLPAPRLRTVRYPKKYAKAGKARAVKAAKRPAAKAKTPARATRQPAKRVQVTLNP